MKPRPYQDQALDAIDRACESHPSTLVVMATGLGKTVVFSAWLARRPRRSIVIAHREELIDQAAENLRGFVGDSVSVEMGERYSPEGGLLKPRVVVASVQTLSNPRRLARFDPREFGQGVIDEAHHAPAPSYGSVMDHFASNPGFRWLGVTATPRRGDELALGERFKSVAFDLGIEDAIDEGWLVPVRQRPIKVDCIDFSKVRDTAGDLNEGDLETVLAEREPLLAIAKPTVEEAGDQPTLVFGVTVMHAQRLADVINGIKPGSARALSGKTDRRERRDTIEEYRAGRVQFLCNCGLFLEGFDVPATSVVSMARPTKSLSLYVQVLGRGTRPLPGLVDGIETAQDRRAAIASSRKPSMLILDFVGNSGRHKIVRAQDVLGGRYGEPVREYARQTSEQECTGRPVEESLERARDELALLAEIRERDRLVAERARVKYTAEEVSPFVGGAARVGVEIGADAPTDKQRWVLVNRLGWSEEAARSITRKQASGVIGKHFEAQRRAG